MQQIFWLPLHATQTATMDRWGLSEASLLGGMHHKGLTTADYIVVAVYVVTVVFVGSR